MSNSKKFVIIVTGICVVSLVATLNLIRKDEAKRMPEAQSNGAQEVVPTPASRDGQQVKSQATTNESTEESTDESKDKSAGALVDGAQSPSNLPTTASKDEAGAEPLATQSPSSVRNSPETGTISGSSSAATAGSTKGTSPGLGAPKSDAHVGQPGVVHPEKAAVSKRKVSFPGIEQSPGRVMVKDVRHSPGEGEDQISVTLTLTDDGGEAAGRVWIIGEYVQHGTTAVMFMPSHKELNLSPDGKPQNPNAGQTFAMRFNTEKKFSIRRPGFEGEELTAIRVGVWDKSEGKLHVARMLVKNTTKKLGSKRADVDVQ